MHRSRRGALRIALVALACAPALLAAQPPGRARRIGFFYFGTRQSALDTGRYGAFLEGMRKLGYVEGRDFVLHERFADGNAERAPALARELVRLEPDVVVATGSPTYRALRSATSTVPVVVTVTADPVAAGSQPPSLAPVESSPASPTPPASSDRSTSICSSPRCRRSRASRCWPVRRTPPTRCSWRRPRPRRSASAGRRCSSRRARRRSSRPGSRPWCGIASTA